MKVYKIASILLGFSHPENAMIDERLMEYETNEPPQYFMEVKYIPSIVIKEEVNEEHELIKTVECENETIVYTLDKKHQPISRVTLSKPMDHISIELSQILKNRIFMMEYIITGMYFFEIAIHAGYLPLHASAIIHQQEAILFSAPSGVGKSTQANLWNKYNKNVTYLNDDKPLLWCQEEIRVFGTPWCGKTLFHSNASAPLKAIIFIKQSKNNEVVSLTNEEKLIHLYKNTHRSQIASNQENTIKNINDLIEKGSIIAFACTNTQEAYHYLHQYLYGEPYES